MGPKITRALLSVYDKTGIIEFASTLHSMGVELLSTGNTAKKIKDAGIPVIEVSDYTGFPEILDGRVKTLQPKIHGGILALRDNTSHKRTLAQHNIPLIDLVVANLYPFEETVKNQASFSEIIENIDVGGVTLIRAAAKNYAYVTVVVDPEDYINVTNQMQCNAHATFEAFRKIMAAKAFAKTASYDLAISDWFKDPPFNKFPDHMIISGNKKETMRYGENPHQQAALYITDIERPGVANALQLQGKELSFNNINDAEAALELVMDFEKYPAVAIIKHTNPCGVSESSTLLTAYKNALSCDPLSAFGGVVAFNQTLTSDVAEELVNVFYEVIIAPSIEEEAKEILSAKKNLRVLITGDFTKSHKPELVFRSINGGFLVQDKDTKLTQGLTTVTKRSPTEKELADLVFAFKVCKHVKSNAIVYAKNGRTVGIGAGQMSRVDSAKLGYQKAMEASGTVTTTQGSVAASDAFFPFPDGLVEIAQAGATAIIQPGGSIRDNEVIEAADNLGLAMVFTELRHFRH